jgi:hypothetical protein
MYFFADVVLLLLLLLSLKKKVVFPPLCFVKTIDYKSNIWKKKRQFISEQLLLIDFIDYLNTSCHAKNYSFKFSIYNREREKKKMIIVVLEFDNDFFMKMNCSCHVLNIDDIESSHRLYPSSPFSRLADIYLQDI